MAVMRGDYAAGPYADVSFTQAEHPDIEWWENDAEDCDDCIHTYSNHISWDSSDRRPTPTSDGIYSIDSADFFGFRDVDYLSAWWSGEFASLERFGFVLAVYEVPDNHARHGYCQSVFNMETAVMLKQFYIPNRRAARRFMER